MGLTVAQAIGIGIVVGFVAFGGAFLLLWFIPTTPPSGMVFRDVEPVSVVPGRSQEAQEAPALPALPAPLAPQRQLRPLRDRMDDRMCSLEDVEATVYFEQLIEGFANACLVRGFRDPPHVPESFFDEDELVRLAGDPKNGGTWSASISNIATRDPYCPPQESLLPPEIAGCYQLICTPKDDEKSFKEGDPRKERTRAMVFLLIDALRLESLRVDQSLIDEAFKDILDWKLTGILERAANGGLRLLAQPGEWEAVWEWEKPGFIVFPEIRFVWDGDTKLRKRGKVIKLLNCAEVDADIVRPISSDNKQHPGVDGAEQPNPDTEKLPNLDDGHSLTAKTSQEPGPSTANQ
ncbi:hypothetical protein CEP52_006408 [Fusarium oligoseptatum]|uniref:Uncharacterized protein n=1 Tax=Fusarium oligoseptatum TaxID=2604345 RepID=A0A428TT50_9HYPO|nr:hypothetical protein CEP52_006408 [Fusarium oligoseptatum]